MGSLKSENNVNVDLEIPKYKKAKESSKSKSSKKSKHKHEYTSVLFHYNAEVYGKSMEKYNKGQYCTICGHVGDYNLFESKKIVTENGSVRYMIMSSKEILDKYSDLEIIDFDPFLNKYVPISK